MTGPPITSSALLTDSSRHRSGRLRGFVLSTLAAFAVMLGAASSASAEFGVLPGLAGFDSQVLNRDGTVADQAGQHPFEIVTHFRLNEMLDSDGDPIPDEQMRTVVVDLPPGLVGDPNAVPKCDPATLLQPVDLGGGSCPPSTQVGLFEFLWAGDIPLGFPLPLPVYNMEPPPGVTAQFAFNTVFAGNVVLNAKVRSDSDYGISMVATNIQQTLPIIGSRLTFWGVPADSAHDGQRGVCLLFGGSCPSGVPAKPFLTTPTRCGGTPDRWRLHAESWLGSTATSFFDSHQPPPNTDVTYALGGCELLDFDPSLHARPTNLQPDAPTGFEIELNVPQTDNPQGRATSHLKDARVTLPEGVSVNPASAQGLGACAPAQIALNSSAEPTCPESSKIGTVELETPLLEHPMRGSVFVAKQGDNPFGSLLAIYIVVRGPGVVIKLPGRVAPNPQTGQVSVTFTDNPQLPFSTLKLRLKGGARAPLANPATCGPMSVTSELTSWSGGPAAHPSDTFTIDCAPPAGFVPKLTAGVVWPLAAQFSPFVFRLERDDGQEIIDRLDVELPEGLLASIRGVLLCPDASALTGSCPAESRIGSNTVGAGAGSHPFFLSGPVYLTGPYRGAPYGLAIVVPAKAGPFDLGTVVVRVAIHVDSVDAHLRAGIGESHLYDATGRLTQTLDERLPTIIEGIPLRLRTIQIDVDRDRFITTPTSCAEKQIAASVQSQRGSTARLVSRFQVGGCRALAFSPRLGIRLLGRRQMRDGGHPGLKAVLRQPDGQANIQAMAVKLPRSLALDPENAQELCEFDAGQRVDCPDSAIIGRARAVSPLLNRPLTGPVYFVKGIRIDPDTGRPIRTLPTLLVRLTGEIDIVLRAKSQVRGRRQNLVSVFRGIPDAPVSRFALRLRGGRNGILAANTNVCSRRRQPARVRGRGHNGKRTGFRIRLRTPCRRRAASRSAGPGSGAGGLTGRRARAGRVGRR